MNERNIKIRYFEPMGCKEVGSYLPLFVLGGRGMTMEECKAVKHHLQICQRCAKAYKETSFVTDLLHSQKDFLIEEGLFSGLESEDVSQEPTVEESFEELQDKLQRTEARAKRNRINRKFKVALKKSTAVAACLVIGVLGWMAFTNHSKQQTLSQKIVSSQVTSAPESSIRVELVKPSGNIAIDTSQTIIADNELKTLLINGKHQMMMNVGAELSIEPYSLGCIVKLDHGEIYTEVEHDGKPFMVETSHGRAVITGTTFNVRADHDKMELAVVEGSVRFESDKGAVRVTGGYQSSIMEGLKPTKPIVCNVTSVSQWAKGQRNNKTIQINQPDVYFTKMLDVSACFIPYRDLEKIDFEVWIDKRRGWFEREFPWTKRLQNILSEHGIQVDTIDLLIESGDLWRFACPEYSQRRILAEDMQVIQKVASQYSIEVDGMISGGTLVQSEHSSSLEALERWYKVFDKNEGKVTIASIHAAIFLSNARSLVWFAVNDDRIQAQDKQQTLDLLAEQVRIASNMLETLNQVFIADKDESVCSFAKYEQNLREIQDGISFIIKLEKLMYSDAL